MKKFKLPKVGSASVTHSPVSTSDEVTEITSGDENRQKNILVLDFIATLYTILFYLTGSLMIVDAADINCIGATYHTLYLYGT